MLAADNPTTRRFVVGYLLSCLDERHWAALADAAVDYAQGQAGLQEATVARLRAVQDERYR